MADELRATKTPSDIDGTSGKTAEVVGTGDLSNKIASDPRKEYVAAPGALWYGPYVRALPLYVDDLGRDLGNDIYDRMLMDPQVAKCFNDLRVGILENGYQIKPIKDAPVKDAPRISKQKAEASPKSQEIADFCRAVLEGLDRPFDDILFEMLYALAYGNKVAELVYRIEDSGALKGRLTLRDIKPKDRDHVSFVVDSYNNVLGIMAFIPGVAWPVMPLSIMSEPEKMPNILPREKFAVLTHRPMNGDPRGTVILRPAYNAWYLKMQTWGEILKWAVQSAGSSLVGILPPNAQAQAVVDSHGNPTGEIIQPDDRMLAALQQVQNGSVSVFPHESDVKPLPVNHESGKAFIELIKLYNDEIANAILGQTLATEEGKHQSRAASGTHADVMSQIKLAERTLLCNFVRREILKPLVRFNFGEQYLHLVPECTMGATDADDFADDAAALAALGYTVDESQFTALDDLLGLPKRADDWMERDAKAAEAAAKLKGQQPGQTPTKPGKDAAEFADDAIAEEGKARRTWAFWRKAI